MTAYTAQLSPEYRFVYRPGFPHYCTSVLNRAADRFWESRYNIMTRGAAPSPHSDANHYGYLAYYTYFSIFDWLKLKSTDVVVDLGCGKGRVSCIAARYPIEASIGVDIDPPLAEIARANAARMKSRRADLKIVCQSATEFDCDDVNVVVMFHPFGSETMRTVLACWEQSLARRPREFRIVYGNPLLSPMLAAKPWLSLFECWLPRTWSRLKFPVHFYRAVPAR